MTVEPAIQFETSFAQQSLWLQHQLDPDRPTYHVVSVVRVRGVLDAAVLEKALNTVMERHEALRTVFALADGAPVQVIGPGEPVTVRVIEVALDGIEAEVREEGRRPFDLRNGPLLRCTLLRLAADHHIVVLALHHIVTDGVSSRILFAELSAAYEAHREGREPELPELPIQYADFAVWQRGRLQGETLRELTDYWSGQLAGATSPRLPADRPRPEVATSRGRSYWFTLPAPLMDRLEALARERRATLFMALLAGFDVLLSRVCGQDDITVTSPTAGRERPELEGLIGYFVNTLPLRVDTGGDPRFVELIDRVRDACVGAWDHQELPYELLLEHLRAERPSGDRTADAPVMVVLQNMTRPSWTAAGLAFEPMWTETGTAKTDLLLDVSPGADVYRARIEYRTDLFDEDTIARMAAQLTTLLHSVADLPEQRISGITLLTPEERAAILTVADRTGLGGGPAAAHASAEEWARLTPDAPAVLHEGERIDYAELDRRATDLADRLRGEGVGPETTVALPLDAGPDLLVALLATSKAGGGHLVLDPKGPAEVVGRAVRDAGASHAVTDGSARPLPDSVKAVALGTPDRIARPDSGARVGSGAPASGIAPTTPPGSLAMTAPGVGYGARSGALHSHSQLAAGARAAAEALGLEQGDRYLLVAPDPARFAAEAWPVLAAGAALVLEGTWAAAEKSDVTVVSFSGASSGEEAHPSVLPPRCTPGSSGTTACPPSTSGASGPPRPAARSTPARCRKWRACTRSACCPRRTPPSARPPLSPRVSGPTSSTPGWSRCRSARRANSTWRDRRWAGATGRTPVRPRPASYRIRTERPPADSFTAPVNWRDCTPTGDWRSSGALTASSAREAYASPRPRSRRRRPPTRTWPTARASFCRRPPTGRGWCCTWHRVPAPRWTRVPRRRISTSGCPGRPCPG